MFEKITFISVVILIVCLIVSIILLINDIYWKRKTLEMCEMVKKDQAKMEAKVNAQLKLANDIAGVIGKQAEGWLTATQKWLLARLIVYGEIEYHKFEGINHDYITYYDAFEEQTVKRVLHSSNVLELRKLLNEMGYNS